MIGAISSLTDMPAWPAQGQPYLFQAYVSEMYV